MPSAYVVDRLTDTGSGSGLAGDLRYCVAHATSGSDTIGFGATGTIELESALPALNASVAIQGPGAGQLTVERDPASATDFGIFSMGSSATVGISGLTLARGTMGVIHNLGTLTIDNCTLSGNTNPNSGGAVFNAGSLTISNSTISDNTSSGLEGGAIYNESGNLTIISSTICGNTINGTSFGTAEGGGIYMLGGMLSLSSSTLCDNSVFGGSAYAVDPNAPTTDPGAWYGSDVYGGGLFIVGGTASIDHSTIAGNKAVAGYGAGTYLEFPWASGGGIVNHTVQSALRLYDTILANNTTSFYGGGNASYGPNLDGSFSSLGHNLVGNTDYTGGGFAATDLLNVDPRLGPLQDNGGPTPTMALLAGSPTVDAGDNTNAPTFDQRGPGFARVVGGSIDIGAFEAQTQPPPAVSIGDVPRSEGNVGTTAFAFTVRLSAASTQTVTVSYATADGTATVADGDYQAVAGTLTFAPGETSMTVTVLVNGDRRVEPNETFVVNLTAPTNAVITDAQGVSTIVDDEPRVSISDHFGAEGNTGTTPFVFTVTLSAPYDVPVTVTYATADGSATAGSDYQAASGTLTIPAGQTTGTVTVLVNGDRLPETDYETFAVNLGGVNYGAVADGQGLGVIVDDEPRISISDVTKSEGGKGRTTYFTFTVTLSAAYDQPVTVSFKTTDGTATTADRDYAAQTGTITFLPGETTKTITIAVNGDNKREAAEYFYVDLFGNGSNSLLGISRGTGTILNDD